MLRLKMPAGVCAPELYTLLDDLSREYGHGHLRLTTRQTFQLHGVAKHNLKTVIKVRRNGTREGAVLRFAMIGKWREVCGGEGSSGWGCTIGLSVSDGGGWRLVVGLRRF